MAQKKTIITSHSGCENTPANSMAHILAAIKSGSEMIEVDIRQDNGFYYLSHDLPENPHSAVSLDEFLDAIKPYEYLRVNCDVKTEGLIEGIMSAAEERGMTSRMAFTGSCDNDYELIRSLGGEFWYSIWDENDFETAVSHCVEHGTKVINLPYRFVTAERVERLDALGIGFSAWTPSNPEEIERLLTLGIYNITTRTPVCAMQLRDKIQK